MRFQKKGMRYAPGLAEEQNDCLVQSEPIPMSMSLEEPPAEWSFFGFPVNQPKKGFLKKRHPHIVRSVLQSQQQGMRQSM